MWLERWWRQDQVAIPVTALDAAIFVASNSRRRVHLCTRHVDAAISRRAQGKANAGITWTRARRPTRVSVKMFQWCFSSVTVVFQRCELHWCFSAVPMVFQWFFSAVKMLFQWCFSRVSVVFQQYYKCISMVFQ